MTIDTDDYNPNTLALQLLTDYSDIVKEAIGNRCAHHDDIADAVLNARDNSGITEALDSAASVESSSLADAARVLVASSNRNAWHDMIGGELSGTASDILSRMAYYAVQQDITEAIAAMTDGEVCDAAGIAVCDCCYTATCDVPDGYHEAMSEINNEAALAMLPDGWVLDAGDDPVCSDCAEDMGEDD